MLQPENYPADQLLHLKLPQELKLPRLFSYHQYDCKLNWWESLVT